MTILLAFLAGGIIGYTLGIWNGTAYLKSELEAIGKQIDAMAKVLLKGKL